MNVLERAIVFAVNAHQGMVRKKDFSPFILHPLEVACIAGTMTRDLETLAAAVLHDTAEDAGITLKDIREEFGERVAYMVKLETENKYRELPADSTWMKRKEESLEDLAACNDVEVKKIWLADKLSNMRSFYRQYRKEGITFWESFNQSDPGKQAWYYRTVRDLLGELEEYDAYKEYCELLNELFGEE